MLAARIYHAAVAGQDGRIYALGGQGSDGTPMSVVEAYVASGVVTGSMDAPPRYGTTLLAA